MTDCFDIHYVTLTLGPSLNAISRANPGRKVLIVEDDDGIRETFKYALELEGYDVITASNGHEALEMVSKAPPRLILLDLMMPVMNGWEFADAIESMRPNAKIPIIVLTAFSDRAKPIQAKEILQKPVDLDKLAEVVKKYCG